MQEKPVLDDGKPQQTRKPLPDKEAAQRTLDNDIIDAAIDGNLEQVRNLFSMGANIDAKDQWENTPLMRACLHGREDVVRFLLDNGANVNAKSSRWTSLMLAACNGFTNVVELLIDRGADMEPRTLWDYTALRYALEEERFGTARLMMRKGARNIGDALPNAAATHGMEKMVMFLVEEGADVDSADVKGITALAYEIHRKDLAIAKFLLEHGANIDTADEYGTTPLMRAVEKGDADAASFILGNGANLDAKNNIGKTALIMAARDGNLGIAKILAEKGASIEIEGKSALIEALHNRHDDVAKFLIMSGADVNAKGEYDETALMHALANGNMAEDRFEIFMLLIDKGARIDALDSYKRDIIDRARYYVSAIPLPPPTSSAGIDSWIKDMERNSIRLQRFLEMAGVFQPIVGKGRLSELALNFAACVS
jgi:ankyrin repeat protein